MNMGQNEVIDLLDDDDDDIDGDNVENNAREDDDDVVECRICDESKVTKTRKAFQVPSNTTMSTASLQDRPRFPHYTNTINTINNKKVPTVTGSKRRLQTSLVLQDDDPVVDDDTQAMIERQYATTTASTPTSKGKGNRRIGTLFEDDSFGALPSSIKGENYKTVPKCRCSKLAKLTYNRKNDRPYYTCNGNRNTKKCQYFSWAYTAERLQWFRFGAHTGHILVRPDRGFSAQDLCQGRVGDCWFLSALAVVAERPDLIRRLFPEEEIIINNSHQNNDNARANGLVKVNLFVDGIWKTVVVDNFLPCMVDDTQEEQLRQAMNASLTATNGRCISTATVGGAAASLSSSSKMDPYAIADSCKETLRNTLEFLEQHQRKTLGKVLASTAKSFRPIAQRAITSQDLAYSKALHQQLWVPFLEKAYAKSHGCYSAISGGHIAEAFLDLTGAPTLVYKLLQSSDFQPRRFWSRLLEYRRKRLPMGCGTDASAAGIVGMHAYSILDVVEVPNVPFEFFRETGAAHGNVSGFTDYDGIVRLLKIRNPHGKGEWKGEFSDKSRIWERLREYLPKNNNGKNNILADRSMKDDGTFWIDYDNFLMGFSNVDVVLAFMGNHAKSFPTHFPTKKSNHRCARAFELSLLDDQPGLPSLDKVEVYVMGIQKTRRGATSGRADRKKSYKVCDLGMLVGNGKDDNNLQFATTSDSSHSRHEEGGIQGQMFGFRRDGHYHLVLDRSKTRSVVVMPISFGHPAATDKELSFVLRFVSDAPLMIRELPETPRMDLAIQKYCLEAPISKGQGIRKVVLQEDPLFRLVQIDCLASGGGIVFLYLCVNEKELQRRQQQKGYNKDDSGLSFSVEATCRGMSCRCDNGILEHETIAKGKKFQAAWRKFSTEFIAERLSRLLFVLYQSGQDTEFGSITCKRIPTPKKLGTLSDATTTTITAAQKTLTSFLDVKGNTHETTRRDGGYVERGIFNSVPGSMAFETSKRCEHSSILPNNMMDDTVLSDDIIIDESLERALELSRGDYELHQALKLSEQEGPSHAEAQTYAYNDDIDFQRALEMSKVEALPATANGVAASSTIESWYENDLEKAIRLSMQTNQAKRTEPVMDLSEDDDRGAKRLKHENPDDSIVSDSKPKDLAEKRKLAAEAALKRLQRKE